ncbi:MAG: aminoacyl-tRNA hydrolase [Anaerolineae bacterium]
MPENLHPNYLLVGLGNPGQRYALTRHNIGFRCIDLLAKRYGIDLTRKRFAAKLGEGNVGGKHVILAKPQTFMNDSGKAVQPISHWFKVAPENILVIYDDLDLPIGRLRLRPGGSSGGHRGIDSIIKDTGNQDFNRLRVGIGRPALGNPIDYVLNAFSPDEERVISEVINLVESIVDCYLSEGIAQAMNRYNNVNLALPSTMPLQNT